MRTTLNIDDDVFEHARELAAGSRRPVGAVLSEMARRGMSRSYVDHDVDPPVIRSPEGTPPITSEIVRRALDDEV